MLTSILGIIMSRHYLSFYTISCFNWSCFISFLYVSNMCGYIVWSHFTGHFVFRRYWTLRAWIARVPIMVTTAVLPSSSQRFLHRTPHLLIRSTYSLYFSQNPTFAGLHTTPALLIICIVLQGTCSAVHIRKKGNLCSIELTNTTKRD